MNESSEKPLLSFVLIAYNQERFIREAVEGAFAQTYSPLEIILSDDCSTDRTFSIMQELAAGYYGPHKIKIRQNTRNLGIGGHASAVLAESRGCLAIMAAGDDQSYPQRAETMFKIWRLGGSSAAALTSSVRVVDAGGADVGLFNCRRHELRLNGTFGLWASGAALTRKCFNNLEPLNGINSEERIFGLRALLLGGIATIDEPLLNYRVHGNSASVKFGSTPTYLESVQKTVRGAEGLRRTLIMHLTDLKRLELEQTLSEKSIPWRAYFQGRLEACEEWLSRLRTQERIASSTVYSHLRSSLTLRPRLSRIRCIKWLLRRLIWPYSKPRGLLTVHDLPGINQGPDVDAPDFINLDYMSKLLKIRPAP